MDQDISNRSGWNLPGSDLQKKPGSGTDRQEKNPDPDCTVKKKMDPGPTLEKTPGSQPWFIAFIIYALTHMQGYILFIPFLSPLKIFFTGGGGGVKTI